MEHQTTRRKPINCTLVKKLIISCKNNRNKLSNQQNITVICFFPSISLQFGYKSSHHVQLIPKIQFSLKKQPQRISLCSQETIVAHLFLLSKPPQHRGIIFSLISLFSLLSPLSSLLSHSLSFNPSPLHSLTLTLMTNKTTTNPLKRM